MRVFPMPRWSRRSGTPIAFIPSSAALTAIGSQRIHKGDFHVVACLGEGLGDHIRRAVMKIHAAVARAVKAPLSLEPLELDHPRDHEILVRVVATGICHTDIAMRDQAFPVPQPIVLGHEGAGVVERIGRAVTKVRAGDPVVVTYNSCGHCPSCHGARASYCHDFFGRNFAGARDDGSTTLMSSAGPVHGNFFGQSSFASHALCHERNVIRMPSDVALESLGPLACGIQTGAGAVMNALKIGVGESLIVFGTGSVGLSAIMAARLVGAAIIVGVDLNVERLALAQELGATHTVDARHKDVAAEIARICPSGAQFALDTTGSVAIIRTAVESLAPLGTCGLLGASPLAAELTLNVSHLMTAGRAVRGIIEGDSVPDLFIPALLELHRQGRFPFDRLISYYPFSRINQAIQDSESGLAIKAVVRMNQ